MPGAPSEDFQKTLADSRLQLAIYSSTRRLMDHRAAVVSPDALPDYQELRTRANQIKRHTIEHLDHYLTELESNVTAHGGKVIFCRDGRDVTEFLVALAKERNAGLIVKSKSMTTEEIHFNEALEAHGLETVETDLG